jgi:hypothetical protein
MTNEKTVVNGGLEGKQVTAVNGGLKSLQNKVDMTFT